MPYRYLIISSLVFILSACEDKTPNSTSDTESSSTSTDTITCTTTLTTSNNIQDAIDNATSGDTICLEAGLYNQGAIVIQDRDDLTLAGITSIDKSNDLNPGGAIISASGAVDNYYGYISILSSSNITIKNLVIEDIEGSDSVGIRVVGSDYITLEDNLIQRTNSSGILLQAETNSSTTPSTINTFNTNIKIYNNKIVHANIENATSGNEALSISGTNGFEVSYNEVTHQDQNGNFDGYKEGIDVKDGSRNGTIHNNYVHHTAKTCIYIDAWEHHTYNIEIYQNNIENCGIGTVGGAGLAIASERDGEIENIFIHNNFISNVLTQYNSAIVVGTGFGEAAYVQNPIHNIAIVNNTTYNSYNGIFISDDFENYKAFENIFIANNLVDKVDATSGYQLGAKNIEYTSSRVDDTIGSPYTDSQYFAADFTINNNALRVYKVQNWAQYSDFGETSLNTLELSSTTSLILTAPTATLSLQTNMTDLQDAGYNNIYSVVSNFSDEGNFTMPVGEVATFLSNFQTHFSKDFNNNPRVNNTIDIGAQEQ